MRTCARTLPIIAAAIVAILAVAFSLHSLSETGASLPVGSDHNPVVALPDTAPAPQPDVQPASRPETKLVIYTGPVEHIFFHPLIAYPERAFDNDSLSRGYDDWFTTVPEFRMILDALYRHNYLLIDVRDLFDEETAGGRTTLIRRDLLLPEGKKPLILSIDDMNYYEYMRENGNVYKLVLDPAQRVASYAVTPQGQELIAYDNEIVPILDAFVQDHPDFSWQGAKGIIALTGYEGILGYRTNDRTSPAYEQEKEGALQVVRRLKETGWTFASHSWGHLDMAKVSYNTFVRDTQRWKDEVEPLIGPTTIYVYPFGSQVPPGDPKFPYLLSAGFRILCSVGPSPYQPQSGSHAIMERRHIDGLALRTQRRMLLHLFDADEVIDRRSRPTDPSAQKG